MPNLNKKVFTFKPKHVLLVPNEIVLDTLQHTGLMSGPSAHKSPAN